MNQTLWITLPQLQVDALKNIFNYIAYNNFENLNFEQFSDKLLPQYKENIWITLFEMFNQIPDINHQNKKRYYGKIMSLKKKISNSQYPNLNTKNFKPNQLISLILIYCDINIDKNLFKALNEHDVESIKKIFFNANKCTNISDTNRRLIIYALYTNDYAVKLSENIIDNARIYAKKNDIVLIEIDNHIRKVRSPNHIKQFASTYPSIPENSFTHKLIEADRLVFLTNNISPNNINNILLMGTSLFFFLKQIPVINQVGKNIHKDLTKASHLIRNTLFKTNIKSPSVSNFDGISQQCSLM